jgi:hypothetical protein
MSALACSLSQISAHLIRSDRRTLVFGMTALNNASCFFLDFSGRLFLVTAAHVYDGYLEAVEKSGKNNIICHVDNIPFDPEARLCGYNRNLDLATFDFSYDDLMKMGKQAIAATPWPPPEPKADTTTFFGGFPGGVHGLLGDRVGRDAQDVSISCQPAAISLSGHIPVPQCPDGGRRECYAGPNEVGPSPGLTCGRSLNSDRAQPKPSTFR